MNRPWIQLKTFDVAVISPAHASSKPSTQEDVPGVSDDTTRHLLPYSVMLVKKACITIVVTHRSTG